jgi:hypothetical protein
MDFKLRAQPKVEPPNIDALEPVVVALEVAIGRLLRRPPSRGKVEQRMVPGDQGVQGFLQQLVDRYARLENLVILPVGGMPAPGKLAKANGPPPMIPIFLVVAVGYDPILVERGEEVPVSEPASQSSGDEPSARAEKSGLAHGDGAESGEDSRAGASSVPIAEALSPAASTEPTPRGESI